MRQRKTKYKVFCGLIVEAKVEGPPGCQGVGQDQGYQVGCVGVRALLEQLVQEALYRLQHLQPLSLANPLANTFPQLREVLVRRA